MKKIALFGGSFNPIHLGHINNAKKILESFELEKLLFIPNANAPHKSKLELDFKHRVALIKLALRDKMDIALIEQDDSVVHYTIDTLKAMEKIYSDYQLYFIMGTDSFINLKSWHKYQEILNYKIIVLSRPGFNENAIDSINCKNVIFFNSLNLNISSSLIREQLKLYYQSFDEKYLKPIRAYLDPKVLEYILEHNLYNSYI